MYSLSSKHAIKLLIYLARRGPECMIQVPAIAADVDIPGPYLAKIIKQLGRGKFVETRKGPGGGVRILPHGLNASFFEVGAYFGESVIQERCFLSRRACNPNSPCPIHAQWSKSRKLVVKFLKSQSIRNAAKA